MKKLFKILAVTSLFIMCSCEPLKEAFGVDNPEQYSKVYMPLSVNGTLSYNLAIDESEEKEVKIYANIGGLVKTENDLVVTFRIERDSLDVYNRQNNTDYRLLPEDAYEFTDSIVTIHAGKTCSSIPAVVNIQAAKLPEVGKYLLPVKLISVEGGADYEINQSRNILYIMINATILKNPSDYPENYAMVYATSSVISEMTVEVDNPVPATFEVNANIGGPNTPSEDVNVTFVIDEDYVNRYNEEYQTSYRLLPAGSYEIAGDMNVRIPAGSSISEALSIEVNTKSLVGGPFMLPVRVSGVTGDYAINEENDLIAFKLKLEYKYCEGSASWSAACPTTEPTQGALENLFDGNIGTFWCTQWSNAKPNPPHVLTIDLKDVYEVHGVALTARVDLADGVVSKIRHGMVHKCDISLSYDNQTWIPAGEFEKPFITGKTPETQIFFEQAFYGRYIKINVTSCYDETGKIGFYQCGLGEFNLYGKKSEENVRKPILTLSSSMDSKINFTSSSDIYDREIKIKAKTDIPVDAAATVTFAIDYDYLDNMSSSCKMFEESAYAFDKMAVTIPAGASESEELTITLKPSQMSYGDYVLPIKISGATGNFIMNDAVLKTQIFASYSVSFDRTGWEGTASTEEDKNGPFLVGNLFDGKIDTFWCTEWTPQNVNPPHLLVIDMKGTKIINGVFLTARVNVENGEITRIRDGVPKKCEISVSDDNVAWKSVGTFQMPYVTTDDPTNRLYFSSPVEGRYIKINVTECWREGGYQTFYQCQLSELNVF